MDEFVGYSSTSGRNVYSPNDFDSQLKLLEEQTKLNNSWSAEQAQKQMDFQERMSNSAHQREIADLKAAGLNPVLSANRGASTPNGASATAEASSGSLVALMSNFASNALETAKFQAEREAQEAANSTDSLEKFKENYKNSGDYRKYHTEGDDDGEDYDISKFIEENADDIFKAGEAFLHGNWSEGIGILKTIWSDGNADLCRAIFDSLYNTYFNPNARGSDQRRNNELWKIAKGFVDAGLFESLFGKDFEEEAEKIGVDVNNGNIHTDSMYPTENAKSWKDTIIDKLARIFVPEDYWNDWYEQEKSKARKEWSKWYYEKEMNDIKSNSAKHITKYSTGNGYNSDGSDKPWWKFW